MNFVDRFYQKASAKADVMGMENARTGNASVRRDGTLITAPKENTWITVRDALMTNLRQLAMETLVSVTLPILHANVLLVSKQALNA